MTSPQVTRQGVTPPGSPRAEPQTVQLKSRLVLLGESAVGKTSLVLQFVNGQFNDHQESTIGAAFFIQNVMLEDLNTRVKFEIWDTAGQERFHSLAPMYYRNAPAAIVVYDITNHESFLKSQTWVKELQKQGRPDVVIALAGNKLDLQDRRDVTYQEAEEYAQQNGLIFRETSARTGKHVRELFIELAKKVPKNVPASPTGDRTRVDITQDESSSKPFFKFDCCNG